jgi:hypothetical protein
MSDTKVSWHIIYIYPLSYIILGIMQIQLWHAKYKHKRLLNKLQKDPELSRITKLAGIKHEQD